MASSLEQILDSEEILAVLAELGANPDRIGFAKTNLRVKEAVKIARSKGYPHTYAKKIALSGLETPKGINTVAFQLADLEREGLIRKTHRDQAQHYEIDEKKLLSIWRDLLKEGQKLYPGLIAEIDEKKLISIMKATLKTKFPIVWLNDIFILMVARKFSGRMNLRILLTFVFISEV